MESEPRVAVFVAEPRFANLDELLADSEREGPVLGPAPLGETEPEDELNSQILAGLVSP